jgi:hypothetical protein
MIVNVWGFPRVRYSATFIVVFDFGILRITSTSIKICGTENGCLECLPLILGATMVKMS